MVTNDREYEVIEEKGRCRAKTCPVCMVTMAVETIGDKDHWSCSNGPQQFHRQAHKLLQEANATGSRVLNEMLMREAREILFTRVATRLVPPSSLQSAHAPTK